MEQAADDAADAPAGQTETYPPATVLSVFEERSDRARPLTANDVMEELGCSRRTAHNKLNALVEDGRLATRKVGARSRVWWIPLREGADEAEGAGEADADGRPGAAPESTGATETATSGTAAESAADSPAEGPARDPAVEASIEAADLPGSGETLEERRDALRAAYDYLSENPNTTTSEFLTEVFPDHPADYKTADEWWADIEPELENLPNVDLEGDRVHVWHYTGG